eukprot:CAMPEP_0194747866 /NCGR_PEP_ID=MMETSP0323_2-20130528/2058_1 /TAXON_ID=2866 ORGANISM="Crypthecodinium cohnii, Strain Seligo" /NCGR_SAMPLE_ID=MMETSP0323_2 /ASSEMBLY_ACC=CAM_ASM_000346 /LENGTH=156 /DNA_ID=CAMNT_0039661695 /DNA_START=612 /DNA_END=1079 /DNA_ORIENTATION=+
MLHTKLCPAKLFQPSAWPGHPGLQAQVQATPTRFRCGSLDLQDQATFRWGEPSETNITKDELFLAAFDSDELSQTLLKTRLSNFSSPNAEGPRLVPWQACRRPDWHEFVVNHQPYCPTTRVHIDGSLFTACCRGGCYVCHNSIILIGCTWNLDGSN